MKTPGISPAISLVLFAALLTITIPLHSQWVQTKGPYGGYVACLTFSGTNLFAGTDIGVFLSTNNGGNWSTADSGLTNKDVRALAVDMSGNLFAGTAGGGVFRSSNNGTSWSAANTGLLNSYAYSFAVSGANLFVGTYYGVYRSTNNGTSWTAANHAE